MHNYMSPFEVEIPVLSSQIIPLKHNCFKNALYECWVNQGLSVVNGKKIRQCRISARKKNAEIAKKNLGSCTFLLTILKFLVQKAIIKMGKIQPADGVPCGFHEGGGLFLNFFLSFLNFGCKFSFRFFYCRFGDFLFLKTFFLTYIFT